MGQIVNRGRWSVFGPNIEGWTWTRSLQGARVVGVMDSAIAERWPFVPNVVVSVWADELGLVDLSGGEDPDRLVAGDMLLAESRFDDGTGPVAERLLSRIDGDGDLGQQLIVWLRSESGERVVQVVGSVMVSQSEVVAQQVWDMVRAIEVREQVVS